MMTDAQLTKALMLQESRAKYSSLAFRVYNLKVSSLPSEELREILREASNEDINVITEVLTRIACEAANKYADKLKEI